MKKTLFLMLSFAFCSFTRGQDIPHNRMILRLNDTNCIRVIDGLISREHYDERTFEVHAIDDAEREIMGVPSNKKAMIINSENYPIESFVYTKMRDSILESTLPYYIKLPILINGQFFTLEQKKNVFPKYDQKNIQSITYVSHNAYPEAPFGVIEVTYK